MCCLHAPEEFLVVNVRRALGSDAKGGRDADVGLHQHGQAAKTHGRGTLADDGADGRDVDERLLDEWLRVNSSPLLEEDEDADERNAAQIWIVKEDVRRLHHDDRRKRAASHCRSRKAF